MTLRRDMPPLRRALAVAGSALVVLGAAVGWAGMWMLERAGAEK